MTDVLKIGAGPSGRRLAENDLPFPVSVLRSGEIVFGDTTRGAPALWIGFAEGRPFVQPEGGVRGLQRNGAPLTESAWLDEGDRLRLGDAEISVTVEDGLYVLADVVAAAEGRQAPHRPPPAMRPPKRRLRGQRSVGGRRLKIAAGIVLGLLALGVALVLAAAPVRIATDPPADRIALTGFPPAVPFFGRYLALPGTYRISAEKAGYRRLERSLTVKLGGDYDLALKLPKLPGFLTVRTTAPATASVSVDGKPAGSTPLADLALEPGPHKVTLEAPRYRAAERTVEIEGRETHQELSLALDPAWGTLDIATDPPQAQVSVDGKPAGMTPLQVQPLEGTHRIDISKPKWKPVTKEVKVVAGQMNRLPIIPLEKADGKLVLSSTPSGATVTVDGVYRGSTPLDVSVTPDTAHELLVAKAGYKTARQTATAGPDETREVKIALEPEYGTVFIIAHPADAELVVDGRSVGRATRRLRLTALPHKLEISREGYETKRVTVTPRVGVSSRVNVTLRTAKEAGRADEQKRANDGAGQKMIAVWLDRPVTFEVGSSRREPGRRSNEARYKVRLTRSFFIGAHEVTNAEFQAFRKKHDSGSFDGISLNRPDDPVTSVSWEDAARYANWLSDKAGLPPAYIDKGGKLVAAQPMTTGYRLPTEAEWVYAARYEAGHRPLSKPLRYSWGNAMPPTGRAGNFADASARRKFPDAIPSYSDGFVAVAPVESFTPNRAGLYDLGGNVSEWCHDFYDIRTIGAETVLRDPLGPASGRFHVVRGASWRQGGVAQLRLAWRDFAESPRDDLGFRVARYAN